MRRIILLLLSAGCGACTAAPRSVHVVPFVMETPDFPAGDTVEISEIAGTMPHLDVGGVYVISGRVHLASRGEARLALYSTGSDSGTRTEGFRNIIVKQGDTDFHLAVAILADGDLNLSLSPVDDAWANDSFGGVYFRDPSRPFSYGGVPRVKRAR